MNPVRNALIATALATALVAVAAGCRAKTDSPAAPSGSAASVSTLTLRVTGMTCASCSLAVRTAVERLDGVVAADVNVDEKKAVIQYEPSKVAPPRLIEAVNDLGYQAEAAPAGS